MVAKLAEKQGREDILSAAKQLFAAQGFDAVSISAIAEHAGSSKANIFHHFGNKQGLYHAVMGQAAERATEHFRRLLESPDDEASRIEDAIRAFLSVVFEDSCRARLVFREVMESGPGRAEELAREVFSEEFTTLTALFEDTLPPCDRPRAITASFLAFQFLASTIMLFHCQHVLRHLPGGDFVEDRERYVVMLRELFMQIIANQTEPLA